MDGRRMLTIMKSPHTNIVDADHVAFLSSLADCYQTMKRQDGDQNEPNSNMMTMVKLVSQAGFGQIDFTAEKDNEEFKKKVQRMKRNILYKISGYAKERKTICDTLRDGHSDIKRKDWENVILGVPTSGALKVGPTVSHSPGGAPSPMKRRRPETPEESDAKERDIIRQIERKMKNQRGSVSDGGDSNAPCSSTAVSPRRSVSPTVQPVCKITRMEVVDKDAADFCQRVRSAGENDTMRRLCEFEKQLVCLKMCRELKIRPISVVMQDIEFE